MPLTMPAAPAFKSSQFGLEFNSDTFTNQLTRQMQVVERAGARWRATYTLPPMKRAQLAAWQAFLAALRGQAGTFYGYDPEGLVPRGANTQVAGATNLILNNRDFTSWTISGATITADAALSPDGLINADAITRTLNTTNQGRILYIPISLTAGTWVMSVLIKREAGNRATMQIGDGAGSAEVFYNFDTNVCTPNTFGTTPPTGVSATSVLDLDGWVILVLTFTIASTRNFTPRIAEGLTNAGGQTVGNRLFVYGAQLESGTRTPLILTGGAAGVRPSGVSVYGAGQSGSTLRVRGFAARLTNALRAGDYIGVGGSMYMLTANANSDIEGACTLAITPALVSSPADGAAVTTSGATCEMRLIDEGQAMWETNEMGVCSGLTFSAIEVK